MSKQIEYSIELRKILAENIRTYRQQQSLSQEKFAEICGLHRTYIGSVERTERNITLNTLAIFANAMDISVPQLLTKRNIRNE